MTPAPKRRWFAYSLRTLFVVMTVAAIACTAIPPTIAWLFPAKSVLDDVVVQIIRH